MNTYEITFTRENGSTGKDRITAANEKQARKDFREIHRHSSATITDVIIAGENRATAFRYEATPICRASFPSTLDEDDARCTVEVTVYRLNAVAVTAFLLDGPETLLRHIGLDERDTYTTKHEIDDLVTVVHITREEAPAWQH